MSDGLQLFTSGDGSLILLEASTGKSYTLLENKNAPNNLNYQYQSYNTDYHHDVNSMPVQHTN
jgi:hypothetical protein